jgi:transglutaminase-like putative cysteine protease
MNHRLTLAAAVAVLLASFSEYAIVSGGGWLVAGAGAIVVVAVAGTGTRLTTVRAAVGATLLAVLAGVPMLTASSLYWKAAGAAIVVVCAASATRLRLLAPLAGLVTYLGALLIYLNAVFAGPQSLAKVVPTSASLRHLLLLVHNAQALTKYSPPVPDTRGVQLLTAASIGLAAIAVDFLAVRLHRPAIAGLPLLVLMMAPITTAAKSDGPGSTITFLFAAGGYLILLSADGRERLRGWGRVVTVWHYSGDDERLGGAEVGALAATGRRIGFAAVAVAILAPLLLPSLNVHRLFSGSSGGSTVTDVPLPNPVDQLHGLLTRSASQPVLSYRTAVIGSAAQFQPGSQYLQVYVLNYDSASTSWRLIEPEHGTQVGPTQLQAAPGVTPATPAVLTRTKITLGSVNGYAWPIFFLPVPYSPDLLHIGGSWLEASDTLMIYSGNVNHSNLSYTATSSAADPTPAILAAPQQLPASISQSYLGFDSPVTNQLRALAEKIIRGKHNAYSRAVALENWFLSGRFTYSLQSTVPNTPAGLLSFLTTNRRGFCQQFAFAFAVLARLVGIPSRVAIGYTAGQPGPHGTWQVTTTDAHAWPELYFSNAGWIRFEPTPGGNDGQGTAVQPGYVSSAPSSTGPGSQNTQPGGSQSPAPSTGKVPHIPHVQVPPVGALAPGAGVPDHHGASLLPLVIALLALIALLAVAAPRTTRLMVRRRRWRTATGDGGLAHAAWLEICDDLEDFGLPCRASESPRAVARRVCSDTEIDDAARQAVGRIASAVEQAQYAPAPTAVGPIRVDVAIVRRELGRSSGIGVRWRAGMLPASTLGPLRNAVRQALGLLTGWMPSGRENSPA